MRANSIDLVKKCCDSIRKYPDDMDAFLNLIVAVCEHD